ncbi:IDEAL domain-containing protein, partial [Enterococcus faecalis]
QLNFRSAYSSPEYAAVLESNPHIPKNLFENKKDQGLAEQILEHAISTFQREKLLKDIDDALDRHDKEAFEQLSRQLNQLT